MKKIIAVCATALLAVGLAGMGAISASATESPGTVTAVWLIPGGDTSHPFADTQTLVSQTPGSHLNDVTVPTTCGAAYQIDVYNVSDITTSLLAGKVLHASHVPNEDLIAGGASIAWRFVSNPPCVITPKTCETTTTLPTSTNLNQQGWVLKPGTAEYVSGGVQLTSTAWDGGKVTLATNFKLSEAGAVAIDYTQGPGSGSVALLFNTSDGNQIHYEPFVGYTQPWFADQAGVFVQRTGSSGSEWADVDLSNLVSDPTITSVVVGVWGGESDVVTVHSATYNCYKQPFDFAKAGTPPTDNPTPPTKVSTGDGSPLAPWYPAGGMLVLALILGFAATRKFATK